MAQSLHDALQERSTGAPEVLYAQFRNRTFGGKPFAKLLREARSNLTSDAATLSAQLPPGLGQFVSQIPRMHIAMPVHLEEWDGLQAPLVAYAPTHVDDMDAEQIIAFDAEGNVYWLDAETPPATPVLVIASNERTDDDGKLLPGIYTPDEDGYINVGGQDKLAPPPCDPEAGLESGCDGGGAGGGTGGGGGGSGTPTYMTAQRVSGSRDYLHRTRIKNDHERWWNEPADIKLRIVTSKAPDGVLATYGISDPESKEDQWQTRHQPLYRWYFDAYGDFLVWDWYEHDSGNSTVTVNASYTSEESEVTTGFTFKYTNSDDPMTRQPVHRRDPPTDIFYDNDVDWEIRWVAPPEPV